MRSNERDANQHPVDVYVVKDVGRLAASNINPSRHNSRTPTTTSTSRRRWHLGTLIVLPPSRTRTLECVEFFFSFFFFLLFRLLLFIWSTERVDDHQTEKLKQKGETALLPHSREFIIRNPITSNCPKSRVCRRCSHDVRRLFTYCPLLFLLFSRPSDTVPLQRSYFRNIRKVLLPLLRVVRLDRSLPLFSFHPSWKIFFDYPSATTFFLSSTHGVAEHTYFFLIFFECNKRREFFIDFYRMETAMEEFMTFGNFEYWGVYSWGYV